MFFVKSTKDCLIYVFYSCNSGWVTVSCVEALSKGSEIDCKKIAERLFKKYKKDMKFFYEDLEESETNLQKS